MYDLIIRGGYIVDPANGWCSVGDVAVDGIRIAAVSETITEPAKKTINAQGLIVQPGVIDTHVHITPNALSLKMLLAAGVTTAVDMAGPVDTVLDHIQHSFSSPHVGVMAALIPEKTLTSADPDTKELSQVMGSMMAGGAMGVKLLGGHFPLTPEACHRAIELAFQKGIYLAWHAGSTQQGSNIQGMLEAIEIADGHPFHLAHINAYCRGRVYSIEQECALAHQALEAHPEIKTESYLSARNGCPLTVDESGCPVSKIVLAQLKYFGFELSGQGLEDAIKAEVLSVIVEDENGLQLLTGKEGLDAWRAGEAKDGSFDRVNPWYSRFYFANAKRKSGEFLVDAISTDGGAIPRNVIIEAGSELVDLSVLTLSEFVQKNSWQPSRMLGLTTKGQLSIGSDADITIWDPNCHRVTHTIVLGKIAYSMGQFAPVKGEVLSTFAGVSAVHQYRLNAHPHELHALTNLH